MNSLLPCTALAIIAGLTSTLASAADATGGAPVRLPDFVVTDSRLLPKPEAWRYARTPDFEVLSNASDKVTRRCVRDLLEFHQAVSVVWPHIQSAAFVPASLILCAKQDKFSEFLPVNTDAGTAGSASLALRGGEEAAIVLNLENRTINLSGGDLVGEIDASAPPPVVVVDAAKELHLAYIHFLFSRMDPRPAPWLEEGLAQLLASMTYDSREITFARLPEPNEVNGGAAAQADARASDGDLLGPPAPVVATPGRNDQAFNVALAHQALMPMDRMFAVQRDSPEARYTIGGRWSKQTWEFVHLCLYGEGQRYQKSFVEFVTRSAREPITEDLFKQCFHMSYGQMLIVFRAYLEMTHYKTYTFTPKEGKIPEIPPIELRDATPAEVGRIKGEALRMAGRNEAAHYNLIAPYIRGSRDPDLLASLGLYEHASGKDDRALNFLDAAVAGNTSRARAYAELGRLRLAAAEAKPAETGGLLSDAQLAYVLTPLFAGRELPPPLPETYETIAQAWLHSAAKPSKANLAAVSVGIHFFPEDSKLIYDDAVLYANNGYTDDATHLVDLGLQTVTEDALRRQFAALRNSLPAAPAPISGR